MIEPGELVRTAPTGSLTGVTLGALLQSLSPVALSQVTLAQLLRTDNFLAGFTVLQLLDSLDKSKLTLVDLVTLLLEPTAFDWESFDLTSIKPQTLAGIKGGLVDYEADVTLAPQAGNPTGVKAFVRLTPGLPADFAYVGGTARLVELSGGAPLGGTGVALKDPVAGEPIEWKVKLEVGKSYRVSFQARPGTTLGSKSTTFTAAPTSAGSNAGTSAASVVVVGDTFEPNDTFTTTGGGAGAVGTGAFYLSYIRQSGDVDYFTYTVPTGTPEGTRITVRLSHLPKDFDLVVYGPQDTLRSSAPNTPPIDGQVLADVTPSLTHVNDTLATQTLDDVVLRDGLSAGETVMGISTNRGLDGDAVTVISHGAGETYTIQVSGFNGASSDDPYMLRVSSTPPPDLTCTPFPGTAQTPATALTRPASPGANVNTLFVVNVSQFRRAYGAAADTALTRIENALPALGSRGFPSAILQVDADSAVQSASTAWSACPASPERANDVVAAINAAIDSFRSTHPALQYIALVGGDGVVPFARLDDLTTVANEAGYDNPAIRDSYLGYGARAGRMLSDDPYAISTRCRTSAASCTSPTLRSGGSWRHRRRSATRSTRSRPRTEASIRRRPSRRATTSSRTVPPPSARSSVST